MNLKLKYMEEYEKLNPDVKFETQVIGWEDYWTRLMSGVAGGDVPDIAQFHNSQTQAFLNHLEPFPADLFDYDRYKEDFINFEAAYLFDGTFHFYPVGIMSGLIFYNTDYWAEAGLTEADIPTTWDEFREIARSSPSMILQEIFKSRLCTQRHPGRVLARSPLPAGRKALRRRCQDSSLNNEAGIKALELIEQLIFEDRVTEPGFLGFSEAMGTGHAAMVYSWSWLGGELNNNYPDLNWGVFGLPTFDGKLAPGPVARTTMKRHVRDEGRTG